mgnify:CR=1 FL=1
MILSCSNISKSFGDQDVLKHISFHIEEHEKAAVVGINGAGKSTFLKILSGNLEPTSGDIVITPGQRLSFLQQDHFKYDQFPDRKSVV